MAAFFAKYKWAIIGTFGIHLIAVLYMDLGVKLSPPYQPLDELSQVTMVMEEKKPVEVITEQQLQQELNGKVSNETVNERDKIGESDKRYDARNFKNIDSDVEQELREFEKGAFNDLAATHKKIEPVKDEKTVKKNKNDTDAGSTEETSKVRAAGRVAGSYDLNGRVHETFAKPAYVCKGSGVVELKIKVNQNGRVVSAVINQAASSFKEECMGENAVAYAYKCKFEAGTKWPNPHEGSITYTYIGQ